MSKHCQHCFRKISLDFLQTRWLPQLQKSCYSPGWKKGYGGENRKGPSDFCFNLTGHPSTRRGPGKSGLFEGLPRGGGCGQLRLSRREAVLSLPGPSCWTVCLWRAWSLLLGMWSPWHPRQTVVRETLGDRCLGTQGPAE